MTHPARAWFTVEDYLEFERQASEKHAFIDGRVALLPRGTVRHARMARRVLFALERRMGAGCEVFGSDLRVETPLGLLTYPDVSAFCGAIQFRPDRALDTALNPKILVEVLSPSTESYDRGEKLAHYQSMTSVTDVLLVAQDRPHVTRVSRIPGGWQTVGYDGLAAVVPLTDADPLPLSELFDPSP